MFENHPRSGLCLDGLLHRYNGNDCMDNFRHVLMPVSVSRYLYLRANMGKQSSLWLAYGIPKVMDLATVAASLSSPNAEHCKNQWHSEAAGIREIETSLTEMKKCRNRLTVRNQCYLPPYVWQVYTSALGFGGFFSCHLRAGKWRRKLKNPTGRHSWRLRISSQSKPWLSTSYSWISHMLELILNKKFSLL